MNRILFKELYKLFCLQFGKLIAEWIKPSDQLILCSAMQNYNNNSWLPVFALP